MAVVRHQVRVRGSRERAFAYVNDYTTVPDWMFGVTRFDPITEHTAGLGATYDAIMRIGPKNFESTLKVTEYAENELVHLESIKGFGVTTRWEFADAPEEGMIDVAVMFEYRLPGGLAGKALAKIIEPAVGQAVKQTEKAIRAEVEEPA